jgi:dimethylaniline monooxygenase (N-oxide forming)
MEKSLGIIGSGVSGLCSAKYGQSSGLKVKVFEKTDNLGGIWESKNGLTWESLKTNNSFYTFQFSDFPVKSTSNSQFLTNKQVYNYLKDYAIYFNIYDKICLNCLVVNVEKIENKWEVIYFNTKSNTYFEEVFDYIIIATGIYNYPNLDNYYKYINNKSNDKIKFIHSSEYKNPQEFENKNIIVVGASFSGTQIAVELSKSAKSVVNVLRKPYWFLSKNLYHETFQKKLPFDFLIFTREMQQKNTNFIIKNNKFAELSNQNNIQELYIDKNVDLPVKFVVVDDYVESIEKGLIKIVIGVITDIKDNKVIINNIIYKDVDAIILCTGYDVELNYLSNEIKNSLDYNNKIKDFPLNLYNCTFNPKFKNLAFVGVLSGSFIGSAEIQANYAVKYLLGKLNLNYFKIQDHLNDEEIKRKSINYKIPVYAISNYVNFCERLAEEMNVLPNFQKIKISDKILHDLLIKGPIVQSQYVEDFNLNVDKKRDLKNFILNYIKPKF